jgi:dTDP-4-dehydrorhamnose reductase
VEKLLIRGIDTLSGGNVAIALRDRFEVVGLAQSEFDLEGCRTIACELSDVDEVSYHVLQASPRWIVYCGPLSASSWDIGVAADFDGEHEARLARAMLTMAGRTHSDLTVLTTDAVFAGPRLFHTEISPATAGTSAAQAARRVEQELADSAALVVRAHAYGWSPGGQPRGFAEQVWEKLSEGRRCEVSAQSYATPILATDLARLIEQARRAGLQGLYHVTGAERTSQHRFAAELALAFGFTGRQVLLEPCVAAADSRPFVDETSLNTRAIRRALETPLPMLREGLGRMADQAICGHREALLHAVRSTSQGRHSAQHAA